MPAGQLRLVYGVATNQRRERFDGKTFQDFSKEDGLPEQRYCMLKLLPHKYKQRMVSLLHAHTLRVLITAPSTGLNSCRGVTTMTEDFMSDSIILFRGYMKGEYECYGCYGSVNRPGHWQFSFDSRTGQKAIFPLPVLQVSLRKKKEIFISHSPNREICHVSMEDSSGSAGYDFPNPWTSGYFQFKRKPLVQLTLDEKASCFNAAAFYRADKTGLTSILSSKELQVAYNDMNDLYCENEQHLMDMHQEPGAEYG